MRFAALPAAVMGVLASMAVTGVPARASTAPWQPGWDIFNQPLDYTNSTVKWSVSPTTKALTVTFTLFGAKPTKLYQVGFHLFCQTAPAAFGRFPTSSGPVACESVTRQGTTASVTSVELGAILTDAAGYGTFTVNTGPVASGIYKIEWDAREAAGCDVHGGAKFRCLVDFQSPGPFGPSVTLTVP